MAQALAGLFFAGASLALLSSAFPHAGHADRVPFFAVIADAYVVAVLLLWQANRVPPWISRLALAGGTLHITAVAYFSGDRPSPLIFFYLWIFLYCSYFFTRKQAGAQIVLVGGCLIVLLLALPPAGGAAQWWIVASGSMIVAAVLIGALRARTDNLIAQLDDAARTDSLTGLANRRHYNDVLDREIARSGRSNSPFAVVVGDLDHFKSVNDQLGHPAGDTVLRRVARLFSEAMRQHDTAARTGGEEFGLLLPDTDQAGALRLAERLRLDLHDEFASDPIPVSICFGISTYPEHGDTSNALLVAADKALYEAKTTGRNRSVIDGHVPTTDHSPARNSQPHARRLPPRPQPATTD